MSEQPLNCCCDAVSGRKAPTWMHRVREILAWLLPSSILVLLPKCPACLAAYVALWTGLGLSFSTASYLRWAMLGVCVSALMFLILKRLSRMRAIFPWIAARREPRPPVEVDA